MLDIPEGINIMEEIKKVTEEVGQNFVHEGWRLTERECGEVSFLFSSSQVVDNHLSWSNYHIEKFQKRRFLGETATEFSSVVWFLMHH